MGVSISGNNLSVPGTATIANLTIGQGIAFTGLAWEPKTATAVGVNGAAFAFPLAVVLATFAASEITALDVNGKSLTNLTGLSGLTALTTLDCSSNDLTTLTVPASITTLDASDNDLTVDAVNALLVALDSAGLENGTVDLSGGTNAAPTGAGATAKANLITKGWTATTN